MNEQWRARITIELTSFVRTPEDTAKLKPFRPKLPRKIPAQLRVEPRSNRYTMVGTAFDYLLRFELQRRAPHAVSDRWVAERVPGLIWSATDKGSGLYSHLWKDDKGVISVGTGPDPGLGDEELAKETADRATRVVEKAKAAVAAFIKSGSPTLREQADLASHAIRLAKLDVMCRAHQLDSSFEEAAQEDVDDLLAMLAIVPYASLLHDKTVLLNPTFGPTSLLVLAGDCDLISGDMLVDFKATKGNKIEPKNLDQLFGYFLQARHRRCAEPEFPEIKRVAFYFCRHGHLWVLDVTTWTQLPEFLEVEQWFIKRAREVFSVPRVLTVIGNRQ